MLTPLCHFLAFPITWLTSTLCATAIRTVRSCDLSHSQQHVSWRENVTAGCAKRIVWLRRNERSSSVLRQRFQDGVKILKAVYHLVANNLKKLIPIRTSRKLLRAKNPKSGCYVWPTNSSIATEGKTGGFRTELFKISNGARSLRTRDISCDSMGRILPPFEIRLRATSIPTVNSITLWSAR